MKTIVKFQVSGWTRDHWSNKLANEKIEDIFNEVKSYTNLSRKFNFRDWYGDVRPCIATIINIELGTYNRIYMTVEVNIDMDEKYVPCPWEIIKPNFIKEEEKPECDESDWNKVSKFYANYYSQYTFISPTGCSRV